MQSQSGGRPFEFVADGLALLDDKDDAVFRRLADHLNRQSEPRLKLCQMGALVVEDIERCVGPGADLQVMRGVAQKLVVKRPQDL